MDIKELKNRPAKELHRLLAVNREKLRDMRFKDTNKQLKKVREIRVIKKAVARILTLLNSKESDTVAVKDVKPRLDTVKGKDDSKTAVPAGRQGRQGN